jgi:uncharacterized membrane protein
VESLRALLYGVSSQRPSHSVFVAGQQLPLEARMGGIFLGFLCAVALLSFLGRLRASQLPTGWLAPACWALIALTGVDGLNAFLFDGNLPHLYAPNTALRLLTGLGAGLGVALIAMPVVAGVVWWHPAEEASLEDPLELLAGLALIGVVGGLILAGINALLWPISVAMLVGVLVAFGVANLYVIVLASGRTRRAASMAGLYGGLISSLGLALLELGGLAALRTFLLTTFGFSWGV